MTPNSIHRRQFLQAIGAAGAVAVAGCLSSDESGNEANDGQNKDEDGKDGLPAAKSVDVDQIARDPTDIPAPVDWNEPRTHEVTIRTQKVTAEIEPGVTFDYMTFEGKVPGPMIRVRQGDTVILTFDVPEELNVAMHNMDFHAVYGPGGGAEATTIAPGDDPTQIRFRAEYPGVFIYHCAVPNMDMHISSGMFGSILVEPEDGLPDVDNEYYLGQHEIYTTGEVGQQGHHRFDFESMKREEPTYVVFNGQAYGFTEDAAGPIQATTGETARVYFANGGPNLLSSLHPIGNVWSDLYRDGDLLSEPANNVETTPVAPGTTTAGEMQFPVPGPVKIVDHALSRVVHRGALGIIDVQGDPNPGVFNADP